ncbi:Hypothetical protein EUBREC_0545 [Agathobacter rectalis ATCC 33656]|uniref:Uncharacterized protein n=1 Tax=Agathobacter rectalis (strain ATCC 33656 / DSM 3377 / JCM 17463 / KCTC 5835 / VPI 0990) TaxID=515619 RepID=C4ZC45_AGARV|nr:Hypothetical protein EUBREC_0545 [Agathobacter rectalis ATCC 33656]
MANLALSGCVVPVWHTVLSLLLLCERCENMCSDFVDTNLFRI